MPTSYHPLDDPAAGDVVVHDPKQLRRILTAMCVALLAVITSMSGLNVAQGALARDLGASQDLLLWIINGYTMVLAALLLPVGAIGDRWGRKPILLTGLAIFAAASVMAALATSGTMMLVARLVAGAGAAMIMPVTLSVVTSSFPEEQRGKAIGVWAGIAGAGGIVGLFFSASMVDYVSWRWLFALPITMCALSFALTLRVVRNSRETQANGFDVGGGLFSAITIAGIVLAFHEGPVSGWTAPLTLIGGVGAVVGAIAFVWWELRQDEPLLDVRVFTNRALSSATVNLLVVFAMMFGLFLMLVQFLQAVLGYSALTASAGLLPMAAVMMPLSTNAPRLAARFGTRTMLVTGTSIMSLGLLAMAVLPSMAGGYLSVLPGLMLIGIGNGMVMTPSTVAITESLPREKQGVASALNDTVREVGGAIGVALLGSVLNAGYRSAVTPALAAFPPQVTGVAKEGIGQAMVVGSKMGPDGAPVVEAARAAFVDGWHQAMWVGFAIAAAAVLLLVFRRQPSTSASAAAISARTGTPETSASTACNDVCV